MNLFSTTTTAATSTSSSTDSDEDLEERHRKKRKWKDYFKRLTRKVLSKQEEMQKKFLEAIDKREREWTTQQDVWRMQEMARINREHDVLIQERSTEAAKDATIIALLQKMSSHQNPTQQQPPLMQSNNFEIQKLDNNGESACTTPMRSSSRWPKGEVHALIRVRTSLEGKYQENGPKAPMWEDVSIEMQKLGYKRSAKRCKEKWENINKYFKKVKESNKERREDSKTCPYFHELDAIYKEKSISTQNNISILLQNVKPNEMMEPLMVQPEQQWRPPPLEEGVQKENASRYQEKQVEDDDDDGVEDEDGGSVEDEGGSRYEIVTNKLSSVDTVE